jgi:hypothetical protein
MEFYLPSLILLLFAGLVMFFVVPSMSSSQVGLLAVLMLAFGVFSHYYSFAGEYRMSIWMDGAKKVAPYILVGTVIVFVIGYATLLFSSGRAPSLPRMGASIPPPSSATNFLTSSIGRGLSSIGMGVSSSPGQRPPDTRGNWFSVNNSRVSSSERARIGESLAAKIV